jgi:HSP20 family molecular chaperone IbpA
MKGVSQMVVTNNAGSLTSINTLSQVIKGLESVDRTEVITWSNSEEFIVRAELPGLSSESVEIEIEDRILRITPTTNSDKSKNFLRKESNFKRNGCTLRLPFNVTSN